MTWLCRHAVNAPCDLRQPRLIFVLQVTDGGKLNKVLSDQLNKLIDHLEALRNDVTRIFKGPDALETADHEHSPLRTDRDASKSGSCSPASFNISAEGRWMRGQEAAITAVATTFDATASYSKLSTVLRSPVCTRTRHPCFIGNLLSVSLAIMIISALFDQTCAQGMWSTAQLSEARSFMGATSVGNVALFAGGDRSRSGTDASDVVDLFNVVTGAWSTARLSVARIYVAAASVGNVSLFAGGLGTGGGVTDVVDLFNVATGAWTTARLSVARGSPTGATSVGNVALFAGGQIESGSSNVVDLFNVVTGIWTTAQLSVARFSLAAKSSRNIALFACGWSPSGSSTAVDLYNDVTGAWSTARLSVARFGCAAASVGNVVMFAGGSHDLSGRSFSDAVDMYNVLTGTWSTARLSVAREWLAAASVGNNLALFAGGWTGSIESTVVDLYNLETMAWSTAELSVGRYGPSAVSFDSAVLFAGGRRYYSGSAFTSVDIYKGTITSCARLHRFCLSALNNSSFMQQIHNLTEHCSNSNNKNSTLGCIRRRHHYCDGCPLHQLALHRKGGRNTQYRHCSLILRVPWSHAGCCCDWGGNSHRRVVCAIDVHERRNIDHCGWSNAERKR
jgi:hypothetical protein